VHTSRVHNHHAFPSCPNLSEKVCFRPEAIIQLLELPQFVSLVMLHYRAYALALRNLLCANSVTSYVSRCRVAAHEIVPLG
jgi:hypothetical protein